MTTPRRLAPISAPAAEGVFIVERLMDAAARRSAWTRRHPQVNYIKPGAVPYTNAVVKFTTVGAFAHMLDRASKHATGMGFARAEGGEEKGLLYGRA